MNTQILPAQPIHPGQILKAELTARNLTQSDLAEIIQRPSKTINQIISGKLGITPDTAMQLSQALGISAETWLNLQSRFQLSMLESDKYQDIPLRAALYQNYPIKEMVKRGWISAGKTFEELEQAVKKFFNLEQIDQLPQFQFSAKQNAAAYQQQISTTNLAWLFKVKQLANEQLTTGKFSQAGVKKAVEELSGLLRSAEEVRHVPKILSDCGIRLVFVESLPNSRLDAACFWLDNQKPVIGMSLRYDRIDNFWFTLRHELEHILNGDGKKQAVIDEDIGIQANDLPEVERLANMAAADFCVPTAKLDSYIVRVGAYIFSERKIIAFSGVNEIHPGLVVGQLHNRTGKYQQLRKYLVPVRNFILNGSTYDGWGFSNRSDDE
ncbi:addiction module antidote protein, HigA family [Neisseria weixii]|uniref:Addiction module antidote protein, HigA family n=1 Tax=Neisseria weixii TaxID=1853276 RepID=A0A3N4N8K7_9NEIS|nr:HigA family addiction module antitoxin [Neisseria weixii]RPD90497.1 addiction module antidote protein, HigA family [Neisseria weixii]RPD90561.1 addiction module antidote protein, HigA family [Neisseria weixii]